MSCFVYPADHIHIIAERDAAIDAAMKAASRLSDMTRDRDEWRQQHENLLAMYRAQTVELAKLKGSAVPQGADRAD